MKDKRIIVTIEPNKIQKLIKEHLENSKLINLQGTNRFLNSHNASDAFTSDINNIKGPLQTVRFK